MMDLTAPANPVGRPRKKLTESDWEKIELYFKAGASQTKIAKAFGMCIHTFRINCEERYGQSYQDVFESFNQTGELLIEAVQFQKAIQGNIQLLIWLGKIRCGQRDADAVAHLAPFQNVIDKEHEIMRLKNEIADMKLQLGVTSDDKC
jgi:hypothetical protein